MYSGVGGWYSRGNGCVAIYFLLGGEGTSDKRINVTLDDICEIVCDKFLLGGMKLDARQILRDFRI